MTATITEQPTIELIVERCNMLTFPEPAIATLTGDGSAYRDGEGMTIADKFPVYVIGDLDGDGREEWEGTVKLLEPAPSGNGWLDRDTPTNQQPFNRYSAARVNPEPVNGRHYRSLGGGASFLVRYNDDEHASDRHLPNRPWSLIRADGEHAWSIPNDGLTSMGAFPYIEVVFESLHAAGDQPAEGDDTATAVRTAETAAAEAAAAVPTWEDGERTATRGFAKPEADGTILLDPELVPGEAYIFWVRRDFDEPYSDSYLAYYTGGDPDEAGSFRNIGTVDWNRHDDAPRYAQTSYNPGLRSSRFHWAKLELGRPEPDEQRVPLTYHQMRDEEASSFDDFNERLNDIAEEAGWCDEYDRIVKEVGMRSRVHRFRADVSVTFTFYDSSPSSRVDSDLSEEYEAPGLELTHASYTGTMTVQVEVECKDEDDVSDQIDTSVLESKLREIMEGVSGIDVSDYDVTDTTEI